MRSLVHVSSTSVRYPGKSRGESPNKTESRAFQNVGQEPGAASIHGITPLADVGSTWWVRPGFKLCLPLLFQD